MEINCMKKTDLLSCLLEFNDCLGERKVILKDKKLISEYKAEGDVDLATINDTIANLGFNYVYITKDLDECNNKSAYAISTNGTLLFNILNDIEYRYITYTTIRKKLTGYLKIFSEEEIISVISIVTRILSELFITEVDLSCIYDLSGAQRSLYSKESILSYNYVFIPFILNIVKSYNNGVSLYDHKFFKQMYEYLFYDTSPLEYIDFGERKNSISRVYGLRLKHKDVTIADFIKELCSKKAIDILYKKSYGGDKSAFQEGLKCVYYLMSGLESHIS